MKRRMLYGILLSVIMSIFVLTLFVHDSQAAEQTKTVRVHSQMPVGHYLTKAVDLFIEEATKRSEGTLQFKHYPAQQLYKDKEVVEALPSGLIEIGAAMNISSWAGKAGEVNLATLSSTWEDYDHFMRYLYDFKNGGGVGGPYMYEAAKKKLNVINLGCYPYARNHCLMTKKPVHTAADWKGLRIRTGTKANAVFTEEMGGSSVFMSSSDAYLAFQRGVMDGAQSGLTTFVARKWFEVAKYVAYVPVLLPESFFTFVNQDFWKSLSKKQKRALADAWLVAAKFDEKAAYEDEFLSRQILEKNGVKIYDVPKSESDTWKKKAIPAMKAKLILPAVDGNKAEAEKIWKMIESTKNLPASKDKPQMYEVPFAMYDLWHGWFLEKEGLN